MSVSVASMVTARRLERAQNRFLGRLEAMSIEEEPSTLDGPGAYHFDNGDVYEGEFAAGSRQGRGRMVYANGSVYEGDYRDDKKEGRGTFKHSSGDTYDGEWKDGKYHGRGAYTTASGETMVSAYREGMPTGIGAMWSSDRRRVVKLLDGNAVEEISLAEAQRIAEEACGLKPGALTLTSADGAPTGTTDAS